MTVPVSTPWPARRVGSRCYHRLPAAPEAFEELDAIIGALLKTRQTMLIAPSARARAASIPYDTYCGDLFAILRAALSSWPAILLSDSEVEGTPFANLTFADAYFSNHGN